MVGFLMSASCWTTDGGTEGGLADIATIDLKKLFPQWMSPLSTVSDAGGDDSEDYIHRYMCHGFFFPFAVQIIGFMHTLHGVSSIFCQHLPSWKWFCEKLQAVSRFLSISDNRARIKRTCFSSGPLAARAWLLDAKVSTFIHWRWGSVMAVLEDILKLEGLLRFGFSAAKFKTGDVVVADGEAGPAQRRNDSDGERTLHEAAEAFGSLRFWSTSRVLACLQRFLDSLEGWAGSCPCHPYMREFETRHRRYARYASSCGLGNRSDVCCPLTGCLAPEVVGGALKHHLQEFRARHHMEMLVETAGLPIAERDELISGFEAATDRISDTLSIKLACFDQLPLLLAGLAHPDPVVVRDIAAKCVQQYDSAPRSDMHHNLSSLLCARSGPFRGSMLRLASGENLEELPSNFQAWVLRARLWTILETPIEEKHARMKRFLVKSPFWSGPFASLKLRMPEVLQLLEDNMDGTVFREFVDVFDMVRTPHNCCLALGLGNHPEVRQGLSASRAKKLIYHFEPDEQYMDLRELQKAQDAERKRRADVRAQFQKAIRAIGGSLPTSMRFPAMESWSTRISSDSSWST